MSYLLKLFCLLLILITNLACSSEIEKYVGKYKQEKTGDKNWFEIKSDYTITGNFIIIQHEEDISPQLPGMKFAPGNWAVYGAKKLPFTVSFDDVIFKAHLDTISILPLYTTIEEKSFSLDLEKGKLTSNTGYREKIYAKCNFEGKVKFTKSLTLEAYISTFSTGNDKKDVTLFYLVPDENCLKLIQVYLKAPEGTYTKSK